MTILSEGFRAFFPLAALAAIGAILVFPLAYLGGAALPSHLDPLSWHRHELVFGFAAAALCGFLLTAIPNWTARPPAPAPIIGLLALLWIAGRAAVAVSATTGGALAGVVDGLFLVAVAALVWRELLLSGNRRNLVIAVMVTLLALANAGFHLAVLAAWSDAQLFLRAGLALFVLLLALIGGRIVPSFTRNWLVQRGQDDLPADFGALDRAALLCLAVALLLWTASPDSRLTGAGLLLAGLLHAVRLARWRGRAVLREPLLAVLHLAFFWLALGLILLGLEGLARFAPVSAIHALSAGAVGTMILAVMTRATLGHGGRPLVADTAITVMFASLTLAALLRVIAPLFPTLYQDLLVAAGFLWCLAFLLFLLRALPICATPRRS